MSSSAKREKKKRNTDRSGRIDKSRKQGSSGENKSPKERSGRKKQSSGGRSSDEAKMIDEGTSRYIPISNHEP
jgi:hypothetical protein